jgi:hypothetical protein
MNTTSIWHDLFRTYLSTDAARAFKQYPLFWSDANCETAQYDNVSKFLSGDGVDITAMTLYYRAEARSKDTKRIFGVLARETIEFHGYGPDQSKYLAVWYFILVVLPEYDRVYKIAETTDLVGMYECYLNTGAIDAEHDWNNNG